MESKEIERLKESFQQKTWSETISYDTWEILKVMSEMVEGFEKLSKIGPCVSIFGSARTDETADISSSPRKLPTCSPSTDLGSLPEVDAELWKQPTKGHISPVENQWD